MADFSTGDFVGGNTLLNDGDYSLNNGDAMVTPSTPVALVAYRMVGQRTADGVWVGWIVHGAPDSTGAEYTGGAVTADSIYVAG